VMEWVNEEFKKLRYIVNTISADVGVPSLPPVLPTLPLGDNQSQQLSITDVSDAAITYQAEETGNATPLTPSDADPHNTSSAIDTHVTPSDPTEVTVTDSNNAASPQRQTEVTGGTAKTDHRFPPANHPSKQSSCHVTHRLRQARPNPSDAPPLPPVGPPPPSPSGKLAANNSSSHPQSSPPASTATSSAKSPDEPATGATPRLYRDVLVSPLPLSNPYTVLAEDGDPSGVELATGVSTGSMAKSDYPNNEKRPQRKNTNQLTPAAILAKESVKKDISTLLIGDSVLSNVDSRTVSPSVPLQKVCVSAWTLNRLDGRLGSRSHK
ncbi:hypothetical protein BaRGS_00018705, partial [Batillaria attramentaria]